MNVPLWPRPLSKREKIELDMRVGSIVGTSWVKNSLWGVFFYIFERKTQVVRTVPNSSQKSVKQSNITKPER